MTKVLLKRVFLLICFFSVALLGFYLGSYYERQTSYQMAGLQIERALGDLNYLHKAENQNLEYSLELSIAVGLIYLPKQDSLMSHVSESFVNRALNGANCYAKLNSWKYISKDTIQIISNNIKEKLVNEQSCL